MEANEIIKDLREYSNTPPYQLFLAYLDSEIREFRKANDSAKEEDVYRNQGAIKALKRIQKSLRKPIVRGEKWNPTEDPLGLTKDYDGGFGE